MTLRQFISDHGITTYEGLKIRCTQMGVAPPAEAEFLETGVSLVSNPSEGVIVVDPLPVVSESTGAKLEGDDDPPVPDMTLLSPVKDEPVQRPKKRSKRKKKDTEGGKVKVVRDQDVLTEETKE